MSDWNHDMDAAPRDGTLIVIHHWIKVPGIAPKSFYSLARWGDDGAFHGPGMELIWRDEEGAPLGLEEVEWTWMPLPDPPKESDANPEPSHD